MRLKIQSPEDLLPHEHQVLVAAEEALLTLHQYDGQPFKLFWKMKFEPIGRHPLENRQLNLIEQLNQTFNYLTSFRGARFLFEKHPGITGLRLNLGTSPGFAIESMDPGIIAAEVFSAVRLTNNQRLSKALERVSKSTAQYKYVFFCVPSYKTGRQQGLEKGEGVQVWSMGDLV